MVSQVNDIHVRPDIQLLAKEGTELIHQYSVEILEHTGIRVESKRAIEIFKKSDGVIVKDDVIKIGGELISHALESAPCGIEIFDKKGKTAFHLGEHQDNNTYFGIGVTNPYFQEIENNELIPFTREHMRCSTSLGHMLENYDMVSTPGVLSEEDVDKADLFAVLDMYANTDKPLVLLISKEDNIHKVIELLVHLHGDFQEKPFCIPYFNPISPLVLNKATSDKMITSLEYGLPVMFSNYGMYGGSTPVTEAGTLSLLNAELLAGLVFGQLVNKGSKMIMGSLPASFDMTRMGSSYTPTTYLLNLACAEMMNFYKLPHCGTSGSSNAWGSDLISSADFWQNHLLSCIGKVGCVPFVGGSFDSMAFSPANVVLSNDIIGKARKLAQGFRINEKLVNINEINNIGHGGNYFTSLQTLDKLSEISTENNIWPSYDKDSWLAAGSPKARGILIEYTRDLYEEAKKRAANNSELVKEGESFINK